MVYEGCPGHLRILRVSPYCICAKILSWSAAPPSLKDAIPVSKHPMEMAGSSPAMTGLVSRAMTDW
jgi:hypothetical protein